MSSPAGWYGDAATAGYFSIGFALEGTPIQFFHVSTNFHSAFLKCFTIYLGIVECPPRDLTVTTPNLGRYAFRAKLLPYWRFRQSQLSTLPLA